MINKKLFYNSILLFYANKPGNEKLKSDLNSFLEANSSEKMTVEQLLKMPWNDFIQTNANEVMGTEQTGFGHEWVRDNVLMTELLERIEAWESLLAYVNRQEALPGANSITFPIKGKKLRMISLEENKDQPQNKTLTNKQVKKIPTPTLEIFLKEMIITIYFTDKLVRNSVLNIAEYIMSEIVSAYESSVHEIILNGDTSTGANTNINVIDGGVADLPDWEKTDVLLFDGARKLAFSKVISIDANGVLDLSLIRKLRAKFGVKGLNPNDLKIVPSIGAYYDILNLSQVETIEKFWTSATVVNWTITAIDWIKIIPREEARKAMESGKTSKTLANNTKDYLVMIHTPSLFFWNAYALETEFSRYAEEKTTGITGSTWIALGWNDEQNNQENTAPAWVIYNIGIDEES